MRTRRQDKMSARAVGWRKWIIILISLLLILLTSYSVYLYNYLMMTKEDGFADSEEMVLQNTDLTEVTKIEKFNGNEPYHIVYGHTNENESKLVFVPLKKDGELKIIKESKIISKNEMEERLYSSCKSCRLIKITPAIIDNRLLWEVTYKDSRNRYVFDYRLIDKGELFEQFKLSSIYD